MRLKLGGTSLASIHWVAERNCLVNSWRLWIAYLWCRKEAIRAPLASFYRLLRPRSAARPDFPNSLRETVWQIAREDHCAHSRCHGTAGRGSFIPIWRRSEPRFGAHSAFLDSFRRGVPGNWASGVRGSRKLNGQECMKRAGAQESRPFSSEQFRTAALLFLQFPLRFV